MIELIDHEYMQRGDPTRLVVLASEQPDGYDDERWKEVDSFIISQDHEPSHFQFTHGNNNDYEFKLNSDYTGTGSRFWRLVIHAPDCNDNYPSLNGIKVTHSF